MRITNQYFLKYMESGSNSDFTSQIIEKLITSDLAYLSQKFYRLNDLQFKEAYEQALSTLKTQLYIGEIDGENTNLFYHIILIAKREMFRVKREEINKKKLSL